ncbi:MAG: PhzF family phenazine biosynthesis protein [Ekhidna sp.]
MKNIRLSIVDSFTDRSYGGNPAVVCLLEEDLLVDQMLKIASEFGLSETAFVRKSQDVEYNIRFFSPKKEIPLCGHATLAAAKVLFQNNSLLEAVHFITSEGIELQALKDGNTIEMNLPRYTVKEVRVRKSLLEALMLESILFSGINLEMKMILLEIDNSNFLKRLKPDFESLIKSYSPEEINGVVVTAKSNKKGFDFESRYFWPWSGTNEDPVTGATHTFLADYWGAKLQKKKLRAYQCSERGGYMEVQLHDRKVTLKSEATIVLKGNLLEIPMANE